MPTMTIDIKRCQASQRWQPSGGKPNGFRDIDAVAAGEANQNHLPRARQQSCGQENGEMPPWTGRRSGFKQCARPRPRPVLHRPQQQHQRGRAGAGSNSGGHYGDPEFQRPRLRQGRRIRPLGCARPQHVGACAIALPGHQFSRRSASVDPWGTFVGCIVDARVAIQRPLRSNERRAAKNLPCGGPLSPVAGAESVRRSPRRANSDQCFLFDSAQPRPPSAIRAGRSQPAAQPRCQSETRRRTCRRRRWRRSASPAPRFGQGWRDRRRSMCRGFR